MYKITSQRNKYIYSIPLLIIGLLLLILIILNPNAQNEIVKSHGISMSLLDGSLLFIGFSFVIYLLERIQEFELILDDKVSIKIGKYEIQLDPEVIILMWTLNRTGVGYKILIRDKSKLKLPRLVRVWELWGMRGNIMLLTKLKDFDIITPNIILTNDEREEIKNYCKNHSIKFQIWKGAPPIGYVK